VVILIGLVLYTVHVHFRKQFIQFIDDIYLFIIIIIIFFFFCLFLEKLLNIFDNSEEDFEDIINFFTY